MPDLVKLIASLPAVVAVLAALQAAVDRWFAAGVVVHRLGCWPVRPILRGYVVGDYAPRAAFVAIRLPSYHWGAIDYGHRQGWLQRVLYWEAGRGWKMYLGPCDA